SPYSAWPAARRRPELTGYELTPTRGVTRRDGRASTGRRRVTRQAGHSKTTSLASGARVTAEGSKQYGHEIVITNGRDSSARDLSHPSSPPGSPIPPPDATMAGVEPHATLTVDQIDLSDRVFWERPLDEREAAFETLRRERPLPFFTEPEF